MAENDAQQRTERPTPKRLDEARKRGQVPRSLELSSAAVTLSTAVMLLVLGGSMASALADMMRAALSIEPARAVAPSAITVHLSTSFAMAFWAVAPVLGVTLVAALAAPLATGGWNFAPQALQPKLERIDPLAGLQRMFSSRSLVELVKALAKFALVGVVAVVMLYAALPELMGLGAEPVAQGIVHAAALCVQTFVALAGALAVIAALDVPYQLWHHNEQLKMSREEVREEMKESEGSPEVKGRIRALQQALARGRMMQEVPTADVVITNPTHYAVALRYDDRRMRAPVVVAKGVDLVAARIRELAGEAGVPLVAAPPLARALHRSVDIGAEVPAALYVAVAQVLTYVYQLREAQANRRPPPTPPNIDPSIH
jgi:flagellar biosynthetic protein FlhB